FAALTAFLPLLLLPGATVLAGLALGATLAGIGCWRLCRGLGGHTGDVLGAGVVLFETGFLLGCAAR
ncbi:MAG: adenosylcobinamide-GDP ribazoletransferase, partial [Methylobacteriaceae bacterium]|nr:adenosylcobinamide-GDP ribazoletransferase [Methylobacteriaceae bacterium]